MFGLENKKKESKEFLFDLETEMSDSKRNKEVKKRIEDKILTIKSTLRGGCLKDDFDQFGILLHGYTSLLKVLTRFKG